MKHYIVLTKKSNKSIFEYLAAFNSRWLCKPVGRTGDSPLNSLEPMLRKIIHKLNHQMMFANEIIPGGYVNFPIHSD